jgi:hypothetical protein
MKYNSQWDLSSIPFDAISPEQLKQWWGLYTRSKLKKKNVSPEERRRLDKVAERMQRYRLRKQSVGESDKTLDNVTL